MPYHSNSFSNETFNPDGLSLFNHYKSITGGEAI